MDTAAAMGRGYSISKLISLARTLDPGLEDRDIAEAGDRLDRIEDDDRARYGLDAHAIAQLRKCFAGWPRT